MTMYKNYPRYIPVIKWQVWEQRALEQVDPTLLAGVQPCIEVRNTKQHSDLLKKLDTVWPHEVLVDYANPAGVVTPSRLKELLEFLHYATQKALPVTPVLGPDEVVKLVVGPFIEFASKLPSVAVRLRMSSLALSDEELQITRNAFSLLSDVDIRSFLIVDLGVSPALWSDKEVLAFSSILLILSEIGFQSVHLLSGAFPGSLATVKTGVGRFARRDWAFWKAVNSALPSLAVGYADYGTLSPEWTEEVLVRRGSRVAIRYTLKDDWLVLRADGNTTNHSIDISELLVNNYPSDFKGAGYSFGDEIIAERADPAVPIPNKRCGHYHISEAWSHHIAFVLKGQYKVRTQLDQVNIVELSF